jgi:4-amino-4-deoxy-L-arabinose transferase-like glycosyltransferase
VPWLLLAVVILCAAAIRIRLLQTPFERDEGEYALAGQLMLRGIPPYHDAWNMKFPGTYAAYAAIMAVFGETIGGVRVGLILVNTATTAMLFLLARRFFAARGALATAAAFALLTAGENVDGIMAHATHFVILFVVAGTLLLLRATDRNQVAGFFLSGLCFGTGVLMKQHGVFFGFAGGIWILATARRSLATAARRLGLFALGCMIPIALTGIVMWRFGVFDKFWFWTIAYAREYATETPLSEAWGSLTDALPDVVRPAAGIWLIAGVGAVLIWLRKDRDRVAWPLSVFFVFSALAVCPGFYFRSHYFILMLPAVALLVGAAVDEGLQRVRGWYALWIFAFALAVSVYQQRLYWFKLSPIDASRDEYGMSPFPEAVEVARYIRAHTLPSQRIAILGSEPEIYFYADRRPATGYIYTYALMESQPFAARMQEEMIGQIEAAKPEYIVMVTIRSSWDADEDSIMRIFKWWDDYRDRYYTRVGVADMAFFGTTSYRWDADAASRPPKEQRNLIVYRRMADGR